MLPEPGRGRYRLDCVVGIDVIRATSTAITAVAAGRRCFPVPTIEAAVPLAARLENPLLAGELGGNMPFGFHRQNSPAEMDTRVDLDRPVILLSTSGTRLLCEAAARGLTYAACLRNARATAEHLIAEHESVLLLAGESRGEFREEDRLCCGRIAAAADRRGLRAAGRLRLGDRQAVGRRSRRLVPRGSQRPVSVGHGPVPRRRIRARAHRRPRRGLRAARRRAGRGVGDEPQTPRPVARECRYVGPAGHPAPQPGSVPARRAGHDPERRPSRVSRCTAHASTIASRRRARAT